MQDIPALPHAPKPAAAGWPAAGKNRLRAWISAGLLLTTGLSALDAWGLALGQARLESAIGEPLRVVIDLPTLSTEEAETLAVQLADPAAYQAAGLEYKPLLPDLRVALERGQEGRARLRLSGSRNVNEAYVDLLLQARWAEGQITRSYTLLLGPATGTAPTTPEPRRMVATPLPPPSPAEPPPEPEAVKPRPARKPAPAAVPIPVPLPASSAPAAPATVSPPAPETTTPAAAPTAAPPAPTPVPAPAPISTPAPTPAPVSAPFPEPMASSWLEETNLFAGVALLLAGVGGLLMWLRRRRAGATATDTGSVHAEGEASSASGHGSSVESGRNAAPASSMMYSPSQLEASGEIDPIAEAEVYLAYGRDQQAEEILRDALHNHPDHAGLLLKLLEIAVKRQDRSGGKALLEQLRTLTGTQGPEWEAANALDQRLPSEIPPIARPVPPTPEPAPKPMPSPPLPPATAAAAATEAGQAPAESQDSLPVLEFDLAPQAPAPVPQPEPAPEPVAPNPASASESVLDFDLSQPAPAPEPYPAPVAAAVAVADAAPSEMLDFDLNLMAPASAPEVPAAIPVAATEPDFVIDLGAFGSVGPSGDTAPDLQPPSADTTEALELDFDLGAGTEKSAPESSGLAVSEDNSALDRLTTRIELAEEFKALGDTEGARALASQVLTRATGELQARARALLDSLG